MVSLVYRKIHLTNWSYKYLSWTWGWDRQPGSYKSFDSLEEGIIYFLEMLYNKYYSKGLTTPELINPKYAEDKNWASKVNKYITSIKAS